MVNPEFSNAVHFNPRILKIKDAVDTLKSTDEDLNNKLQIITEELLSMTGDCPISEHYASIKQKIQELAPQFKSEVYDLFSTIVAHPQLTVIAENNETFKIFTSELISKSKLLQRQLNVPMKDIELINLSSFNSAELKHLFAKLKDAKAPLSLQEALDGIALADYLDSNELAKICEAAIPSHINSESVLTSFIEALLTSELKPSEILLSVLVSKAIWFDSQKNFESILKILNKQSPKVPLALDLAGFQDVNPPSNAAAYLDFLLKNYPVNSLNLSNIRNFTPSEAFLESLRSSSITELYLDSWDISGLWITDQVLSYLPKKLEILDLYGCVTLPSDSAIFSQLPLKSLNLGKTFIRNITIANLPATLEVLLLNGARFDFAEDIDFTRLRSLITLDLSESGIAFYHIKNLPLTLKHLNLSRCGNIGYKFAPYFSPLNHLETIDISFTEIGDDGVLHLSPNLLSLKLSGCSKVTLNACSHFLFFTRLKTLHINKCQLGDALVDYIPETVEDLNISSCNITSKRQSKFSNMIHLKKLDLSSNPMGNETVLALPNGLEELDISQCSKPRLGERAPNVLFQQHGSTRFVGITDGVGQKLSEMTSLRALNLSDNADISDEMIQKLPPSLTILKLKNCKNISDQIPTKFFHLIKLWSLDVSNTSIGPLTAEFLPSSLREIDLDKCKNISNDLSEKIEDSLKH